MIKNSHNLQYSNLQNGNINYQIRLNSPKVRVLLFAKDIKSKTGRTNTNSKIRVKKDGDGRSRHLCQPLINAQPKVLLLLFTKDIYM